MLQVPQLKGGLIMFFFQFLIQAGVFFVIPLYLSVALGLSAIDTGLRIMPLSITLLAAAVGIPRYFPGASPRLVVRLGVLAMFLGIVTLLMAIDVDAGPEIVTMPLLLVGLGIGALASQLGAVTVSAVPDEQSPEVGGLQNTATNLGASIGTALAGSLRASMGTPRSRTTRPRRQASSWRAGSRSCPTRSCRRDWPTPVWHRRPRRRSSTRTNKHVSTA
jgi:MFS family permease